MGLAAADGRRIENSRHGSDHVRGGSAKNAPTTVEESRTYILENGTTSVSPQHVPGTQPRSALQRRTRCTPRYDTPARRGSAGTLMSDEVCKGGKAGNSTVKDLELGLRGFRLSGRSHSSRKCGETCICGKPTPHAPPWAP